MTEFHHISSMMMSMLMMKSDTINIYSITILIILLLCIQVFNQFIKTIQDEIAISFDDFLSFYRSQKMKTFKLQAKISYKNHCLYERDITNTFKAVMNDIYVRVTSNTTKSINYTVQDVFTSSMYNREKGSIKMIVFNNKYEKFEPYKGINIKINYSSTISEKGEYTYDTYTIIISADNDDYTKVINYVDNCVNQYDAEQANSLKDQHIFVLSDIYIENKKREITFDNIPFNTTKTFESMFFDEKDSLISYLDYFMNNEYTYRKLGKPYTFGILLHGYPGTGKTSFIKAMAKYTNRHIIVLSSKKIKNIDALKDIFYNENINDVCVPHNKRLYVFEEIDCGPWKNMVQSRNLTYQNSINENNANHCVNSNDIGGIGIMVHQALHKALKVELESEENEKKSDKIDLNLGDFLDLLDGIIEIPGRMIVFTSNHPEVLDQALLRPGRIDKIVEFKKMTRDNIADMYKLWFDCSIPQNIYEKLIDYKYSQAEIGNIFEMISSNNMKIESLLE